MGYDLFLVESTGDKERDYFRLNIWGMQVARGVMDQRGMLHRMDPVPNQPRLPGGHFGNEDPWEYVSRHTDDDLVANADAPPDVKTWCKNNRAFLMARDKSATGMAVHKFCSNDGWIVTVDECISALAAWEVTVAEGQPAPRHEGNEIEWWSEWIAYLELAVEHGGFRVY